MKIRNILVALLLGASSCGVSAQTSDVSFLSGSHCIVRMAEGSRYIMLPVQENAEICNIKVIAGNNLVRTIEVRLAVDNVDYYVPFDLSEYDGKKVLFPAGPPGFREPFGLVRVSLYRNIRRLSTEKSHPASFFRNFRSCHPFCVAFLSGGTGQIRRKRGGQHATNNIVPRNRCRWES